MQENTTFIRDDVLPSYWANRLQQLLSTYSDFVLSQASTTSVQIVAGADELAAICTIEGRWRFVEATVTRAHPGGAAAVYDIFATCKANDVSNVPDPFTDNTDYSFNIAIVAHGATPPIVAGVVDHVRKIGECKWDGAKITKVTQTVGVAPPDSQLVVGDVKLSLQAADHAGWIKLDGRANLPRADYPTEIVGLMDGLGLVGVDGLHFAVPDGRGRVPVGVGTHADVSALLATEPGALPVGSRRVRHKHVVNDPGHAHPITAVRFLGDTGDLSANGLRHSHSAAHPGFLAEAARGFAGQPDGDAAPSGTSGVATGISVGQQASVPTDSAAYLAFNIFVFTGEGSAASGGGGGAASPRDAAPQIVTGALVTGTEAAGAIALPRSTRFLRVSADRACRVRMYMTAADRDADAARSQAVDPPANSGVILDLVFIAGVLDLRLSPQVVGSNFDVPVADQLYYRVRNDGAAGAVTVNLTIQKAE